MKTKSKLDKAISELQAVQQELATSEVKQIEKKTADSQLVAVKKSDEKRGMTSKTYKLQETLVDQFQEVCEISGIPQSAVLSMLMGDYISSADVTAADETPCNCLWCRLARFFDAKCKQKRA